MTEATTPPAVSEAMREAVAPTYGIIDPDYARVFTQARCLAWAEGYALMMHGSFTRDLDLIAVPWTEQACEPEHLVNRIADTADLKMATPTPSMKAHGRLAWTLLFQGFGDPRFIDLSIVPRASEIARLTGERDAARSEWAKLSFACGQEWARAEAAEAETARLRAALEPFVREADRISPAGCECEETTSDRVQVWQSGPAEITRSRITYGDLRRARAALTSQEQADV